MKNKGFTLMELLIVLVLFIILAVAFSGGFRGSGVEATQNARLYAHQLYPEFQDYAVACAGSDSDQDGYISCSIRGRKADGGYIDLSPVACAGGGFAGFTKRTNGCKPLYVFPINK